jgi:flagellar basal-body rod protein FlgF/flagellar basal-body rod protein FlgG
MDSGLYAAYAGLLARNETLDSAASNLANASTTGFRAEREYFREAVAGADSLDSQLGKAANNFSVLGGNIISQGQGQVASTGNPLDLALQGSGFFSIQGKDDPGAAGVRYTRDGSLHRASDGTIETASGEAVLNAAGKPLIVPPGEITVGDQGDVSVGGAIAGRLGIYELPATGLSPEGVNRYKLVGTQLPVVATGFTVRQGFLESSNQDVIQGSLQLVVLQRQAEMMQKALNVFQGTLDKTASEDLPRVAS